MTTSTYPLPTSVRPAQDPEVNSTTTDGVVPAGRGWARAGIAAGALGLATFAVAGGLYGSEDALIDNARVVAEIDGKAWIVWAYQVMGVATAAALVVFGLGLKRRLEQQEPAGSLVPATVATGLLLTAVMCLVGSGISTELFHDLRRAADTDPDTIGANLAIFNTLGWVWAATGLASGGMVVAARRGSVSTGFGRASLAATALIVLTQVTPFQYLALVPASLWMLGAGIVLSRSEPATRAADLAP